MEENKSQPTYTLKVIKITKTCFFFFFFKKKQKKKKKISPKNPIKKIIHFPKNQQNHSKNFYLSGSNPKEKKAL